MASELDEFENNIENLKAIVRNSFTRIYATLRARELKTLRQLDAIRKQCQVDNETKRNFVQNIHIYYENESTLLDNVNKYGVIDFKSLNFDGNNFTSEDCVDPNDDHIYSYDMIHDLPQYDNDHLHAVQEAVLKEKTRTDTCVCNIGIQTEGVSNALRDMDLLLPVHSDIQNERDSFQSKVSQCADELPNITEDEKSESSDSDPKKINPTDDWLNSIKNHPETEPTQVIGVMEHSTIACS